MGRLVIGLYEVISRFKFWKNADHIGPDMPLSQLSLFFPSTMKNTCKKKFKHFGSGAEIRPGAYIDACSKISIGRNVVIRPLTFLYADPREGGGEIIIEDDVLIGSGVHCYTNNHEFTNPSIPIINQGYPVVNSENGIIIKRGAWIGAGCIILPGVVIGENSVIGAGAVVTRSIPARSVAIGVPAHVIETIGGLNL
jgi:acetyltransferase-like isoleucine patch superfamily enzyme